MPRVLKGETPTLAHTTMDHRLNNHGPSTGCTRIIFILDKWLLRLKKLTLLLFLLSSLAIQGQTRRDSLLEAWRDENQPDTLRMSALYQIGHEYIYSRPDTAFYYSQQLYDIATRLGDKVYMARALNLQGSAFWQQGVYSRAMDNFYRSLELFEETGNEKRNRLGHWKYRSCLHKSIQLSKGAGIFQAQPASEWKDRR